MNHRHVAAGNLTAAASTCEPPARDRNSRRRWPVVIRGPHVAMKLSFPVLDRISSPA